MRHLFRLMIILAVFFMIFLPEISICAKSQKTALVIGNAAYKSSYLRNPVNDATDIASVLKKLGFKVILKTNANQRTMKESIRNFGKKLRRGGVGLFYYAGHAVQVRGTNYLIPIGVKIESESDVEYEAIDAGRVLGKMEDAGNGLNIIILDSCRDNPFARSFRTSEKGLARMDAPTGSILAYATAPGSIAADGTCRNGLYTSKLLKHIATPGLEIGRVFRKVRIDVVSSSQKKQVPWESSSLIGEFYFNPKRGIAVVKSTKKVDTGLKAEQERLEKERKALARIEAEIEERKRVEVDRKRIEAKKKKLLAMSNGSAREIENDGRFIAYDNGTVKDTKTSLMWASKDNGEGISWKDARRYCENYRGGGYTDWRMPTKEELAGLYDKSESYRVGFLKNVNLTKLIELSGCCPWASETLGFDSSGFKMSRDGLNAAYFSFTTGYRRWDPPSVYYYHRALPVRRGK